LIDIEGECIPFASLAAMDPSASSVLAASKWLLFHGFRSENIFNTLQRKLAAKASESPTFAYISMKAD